MLTITLNYKDPRMALCLNLSFEYINLFKKVNVIVDGEHGHLTISGEQTDIKYLLEQLYDVFHTDNGLINMLIFMYINATGDNKTKFGNPTDLSKIMSRAKQYKTKFLI